MAVSQPEAWRSGGVLAAARKPELMKKYGVTGERELLLALVKDAEKLALTGISGFRVGIVGLEKETGDILFGGNLEFPGQPLGVTVHAEQFLFARAFHRGHSIATLVLRDPTPCGHCRQFMIEFAGGKQVRVINAQGVDVAIGELLPLDFGPEQLGQEGVRPGSPYGGPLKATAVKLSPLQAAALAAAAASYTPYSKTSAGVALQTKSGEVIPGSSIENAAFNPSLPPLQSALINLIASGGTFKDIRKAVLAQTKGAVDHSAATKTLLKQIAAQASFATLKLTASKRGRS